MTSTPASAPGAAVGAPPEISVVMGVHNAADSIAQTLGSLLEQEGVDLEIILIDDGSSDATGEIVTRIASRDPRLRLISRANRGLTQSLIEACNAARGTFLCRQDAGDWSLPGRLRRQRDWLTSNPDASLCSTHVRLLVPEGATLAIRAPTAEQLRDGLTGPAHHGSVMMRRQAYEQAGGYRPEFYYAQDIDLWSRLSEIGDHEVVPEVLYEASLTPGAISGTRKREQQRFHALITAATQARRRGQPEERWLRQAQALSQHCREARRRRPRQVAAGAYFIGASLRDSEPSLARRYLEQAVALDPWHLRAHFRLWRQP